MARSRQALEHYFDSTTARILDALVEGLSLHRALDNAPQNQAIVTTAIGRITAQASTSE